MKRLYVDTSVAFHALVGTPMAAEWFDEVSADDEVMLVFSRLLRTELTRVLRREGSPVSDRELVLGVIGFAPITEAVLVGAEAITEHVKTLHAVHLATALVAGGVVMVSHDAHLLRVAEMLGLSTLDPIGG